MSTDWRRGSRMKALVGDDAALGWLRVLGATMARLAEAGVDGGPRRATRHPDERTPGRTHHRAGVPRRRGVHPTHRAHCSTLFTAITRPAPEPLRGGHPRHDRRASSCGVGFADLSGFTALTQLLTTVELSNLLARVQRHRHRRGARGRWPDGEVHRRRGDVGELDSELLAKVAVDLVEHPRAREAGLQVRAGLGYGRVLAIGGDYFGNRGQPGSPPGRGRRARSDPCRGQCPRRAARLAGDPAGSVDTQGFRVSGDGLRPAPEPLTARVNAREPRKSRLSGPRRHRRLVTAQTQEGLGGADRARCQRPG